MMNVRRKFVDWLEGEREGVRIDEEDECISVEDTHEIDGHERECTSRKIANVGGAEKI